jgi:8-oxo-dGTP pyrophosphatase MutT (NUDIX family)
MRTVKQLTNNKYLNIKEVVDKENHVNGFQFAERRGVDSVAFICLDRDSEQFLLNKELKPPINERVLGSFGGSFDKDKLPVEIVIDEVKEEAGFVVTKDDVKFVGRVLVSTQMNQYCYLYLVFVNKEDQGERKPENLIEASAETFWCQWDDIYKLEDWKPITILAMAQAKAII